MSLPPLSEPSWLHMLEHECSAEYFRVLHHHVSDAYTKHTCYPPIADIWSAFAVCPFDQVTVVILGQDPYHGPHQAHGLAFSVRDGIKVPPSLRNIFTEIKTDTGMTPSCSSDLTRWSDQGVLLLNSTLTVQADMPASHAGWGWEKFTDQVIRAISLKKTPVVFLLWGAHAERKRILIDEAKHCVLIAPHPSPLSAYRGFFGCRHFSQTNAFLVHTNQTPIVW